MAIPMLRPKRVEVREIGYIAKLKHGMVRVAEAYVPAERIAFDPR
ncbi:MULTISPECIES: hypothetical protein [unclassified Sphingobium]|nr:hypothetical protein [Sphingobium sp. AntQ-1]